MLKEINVEFRRRLSRISFLTIVFFYAADKETEVMKHHANNEHTECI
jgi:hypothetical protein